MMGMLNSILIAVAVTVLTIGFGTAVGLVIAYYGGRVDNIVMRLVDFMVIIPTLMVIIVFVSIKRDYGLVLFILILSAFAWMSSTRLVRSKALSESRRDYVLASKTMGTPDWKIMLQGILDADVLINKMYIWLPAALAILIIVLCINSIGGALRRSLDARQRL